MAPKTKKSSASKKIALKFTIDCSKPVNDAIFDMAAFEKFMHDKYKVDGKTGQMGSVASFSRPSPTTLCLSSSAPVSKRYLKYLTKKYLKKIQLRDYLHIVACSKTGYELKYFNIDQGEEAEE